MKLGDHIKAVVTFNTKITREGIVTQLGPTRTIIRLTKQCGVNDKLGSSVSLINSCNIIALVSPLDCLCNKTDLKDLI